MCSRWVELFAIKPEQFTAEGIATVLVDEYCTKHGVPRTLLSDRGAQFMAALSKAVYVHMGIRKLYTTAYHPQCNGMVERFMQTLAQMLSMVVNDRHSDWHLWLIHVSFAYNRTPHSTTGVSPFLLATGREPRVALHQILGSLDNDRSRVTSVSDLVGTLVARQQGAQAIVERRQALKQQYLLKNNAKLAKALGLRANFVKGGRVWVYKAPVTSTEPEGHVLSRKFFDQWQGPYRVSAVSPASLVVDAVQHEVQANVLLLHLNEAEPARVTVHRCKVCKDPTSLTDKPTGLPTGFARYLLTTSAAIALAPPSSVDDNEATWESDRYGVEAIVDHRLVIRAKGRAPTLEYRVQWRASNA